MDLQKYFGDQSPPRDHFVSVLEHWADLRGDQPAFIFTDVESVGQTLTYAELWDEVRALAGYLQGRCRIRSGDRVLLLYPPGLEFVIGFFACHAAGAIAVPAYPPRRNRKASEFARSWSTPMRVGHCQRKRLSINSAGKVRTTI